MGMFDYLRCEMELPGGYTPELSDLYPFQTKGLECLMHAYIITSDGRLTVECPIMQDLPEDQWERSALGGVRRKRQIGSERHPVYFHGDLEFYDHQSFSAHFIEGRCVMITCSDRYGRGEEPLGESTLPESIDRLEEDAYSARMSNVMKALYFMARDAYIVGAMKPHVFESMRDKLVSTSNPQEYCDAERN